MQRRFYLFLLVTILYSCTALSQGSSAGNPVIYADVPDMSMIRVGDTYYMSSTTMHMAPGVPIMKSKDLVNWELVNYCYDILADVDALNLIRKNAYGSGTWASCIRYHNNMLLCIDILQHYREDLYICYGRYRKRSLENSHVYSLLS